MTWSTILYNIRQTTSGRVTLKFSRKLGIEWVKNGKLLKSTWVQENQWAVSSWTSSMGLWFRVRKKARWYICTDVDGMLAIVGIERTCFVESPNALGVTHKCNATVLCLIDGWLSSLIGGGEKRADWNLVIYLIWKLWRLNVWTVYVCVYEYLLCLCGALL